MQADELFERAVGEVKRRQRLSESTYRLQFHAEFTFADATRLVPYLHRLGITDCYASPYLKARPGSMHGYDIIDHHHLNPEIGSDEQYAAWTDALREHGMGQLLDVVPNHMGILGNENIWWNDVLENGPASAFADYFDIDWHSSPRAELRGRLLLPLLGQPYGTALESGEIRLEHTSGGFALVYFEHRFPVAPDTYSSILERLLQILSGKVAAESPVHVECQSILTAVRNLPGFQDSDPARRAERQREKEVIKKRLATLFDSADPAREALEAALAEFNGTPGKPEEFDLVDNLLNQQPYRLAYWRVAADEINYRRFFEVNELAALRMDRAEVFNAAHERVFALLREGRVSGLRIDHPDGLFDPRQYLRRLQERYFLDCARTLVSSDSAGSEVEWSELEGPLLARLAEAQQAEPAGLLNRPLYLVVEKILGVDESLPADWPVHGTTGYDFLNQLNGVFVDSASATAFRSMYHDWLQDETSFPEVAYRAKFLTLQVGLSSELHMLAYRLDRIAQGHRWSRDFTVNTLRHALREVIACFPVYRSYLACDEIRDADRNHVQTAVKRARLRNPAISGSIFDFIRDVLLFDGRAAAGDREERRRFAGRFEQLTAPVTAKGVEDTAFYTYNCLLSLNEVGGTPIRFGVLPELFHRWQIDRQTVAPRGLVATSTHDTKRSEDVRARLNVLSEMPEVWHQAVSRWSRLNAPHRETIDDSPAPDSNEEYHFYQIVLGAWPITVANSEQHEGFVRRIQAYMVKALHEAKVHSSWINPNAAYDAAVERFVGRVLDRDGNKAFLDDFIELQRRVSHWGMLNSLGQTLLKVTCPGVADVYQGAELWDFSLVDPDNRRSVDYTLRDRLLRELQSERGNNEKERIGFVRKLLENKEDGCIKLYLLSETLLYRRDHPGLFAEGAYLPLAVQGARQDHLLAFARRRDKDWAIVAVPRLMSKFCPEHGLPLGPEIWGDARIVLPQGNWDGGRNLFTLEAISVQEDSSKWTVPVADLLRSFPVALFGPATDRP